MAAGESGQREFWDARAAAWEQRADALDAFSDTYGIPVMDALAVAPGERVLDVGCGPGTTSVELARRVGPTGTVVGVDISGAMVAAAERRADRSGTTNATFTVADAGADPLGNGFDAVYSRFGVMFFDDPTAAFTNLGRALRPGGRLGCTVWGRLEDNPWMFVPTLAAAPVLGAELALPGPGQPGPFSLADPDATATVLRDAGFEVTAIDPIVGVRLIQPATADLEILALLEVGPLGSAYSGADESGRAAAVDAVREALQPFEASDGWRLPGTAMKVLARRP
ncbi:MAG: SAM-dependent methyltransferase [Acidimicrobiales bacterium]|nr:SAM-dependent methyltransferase [Acidimicrobiales bacterium]